MSKEMGSISNINNIRKSFDLIYAPLTPTCFHRRLPQNGKKDLHRKKYYTDEKTSYSAVGLEIMRCTTIERS